jgi:hypothetical protein
MMWVCIVPVARPAPSECTRTAVEYAKPGAIRCVPLPTTLCSATWIALRDSSGGGA